jgi:hypothetical protein
LSKRLEEHLREAQERSDKPFFSKYDVLKRQLLTADYSHWAAKFPGGNDHGPGHVERVLEKLDGLLGDRQVITGYELFLTMMAILYHDVGILGGREEHSATSATFIQEERNDYIIDVHDRDVIAAAVYAHSSSRDIEEATRALSTRESIGNETVRPQMIAALVRLADELDEDFNRANPTVAKRLSIPTESQFYWEFCQRIRAILPHSESRTIEVTVKFDRSDPLRSVKVGKSQRPFICLFAEKLAKINRERIYVNRFLPETIKYDRMRVTVNPLPGHRSWLQPRDFDFTDKRTDAGEFVKQFRELLEEPAAATVVQAMEHLEAGKLDRADTKLRMLERMEGDLPVPLRLKLAHGRALVKSMEATRYPPGEAKHERALNAALRCLKKWVQLGLDGGWTEEGTSPQHELRRMFAEERLKPLFAVRLDAIASLLPKEFSALVPPDPGASRSSRAPSTRSGRRTGAASASRRPRGTASSSSPAVPLRGPATSASVRTEVDANTAVPPVRSPASTEYEQVMERYRLSLGEIKQLMRTAAPAPTDRDEQRRIKLRRVRRGVRKIALLLDEIRASALKFFPAATTRWIFEMRQAVDDARLGAQGFIAFLEPDIEGRGTTKAGIAEFARRSAQMVEELEQVYRLLGR